VPPDILSIEAHLGNGLTAISKVWYGMKDRQRPHMVTLRRIIASEVKGGFSFAGGLRQYARQL